MRRSWMIPFAIFAACGGAPVPSGPLTVRPTEYDSVALTQAPLSDGDPLDLVAPPQGGFVAFVGGLIGGMRSPNAQLTGRVLDPGGAEVARDSRTVILQPLAGHPGTYTPDLRSYVGLANLTLCPSSASTDRVDHPVIVELAVTELETGRTGTGQAQVTLVCRQPDASSQVRCRCQCAAGYYPGKCM
jgi:hypothetical protein